jgi:general secretion pathway protein C
MVPMVSKPNYNQVRIGIMERNLFNSEGKFPDEKERGPDGPSGVFDANAACSPTTLPLELLGTIYTGNSADSIATVKDREYTEPDIYRAGESIIGYDQAKIFKIERSRVIINNNNSKECLELSVELPPSIAAIQEAITADSGDVMPPGGQPAVESSGEINLEQGYVEKELGAGLSNILNKARLVPNVIDGGVQGFKIFAIEGGTLFDKIGLQNGDVITRVNDISLQQPEQGFALYEAFQNEKEIRIFILRDGTTPRTINVRVR